MHPETMGGLLKALGVSNIPGRTSAMRQHVQPMPAPVETGFAYVHLVPERIQVWRGPAEFSGRTVMRAGVWLDEPVD